ncbi:MAG: hypothetical protein HUU34_21580 [Saprospiraceae bacterium]|nr:hypothetical protein [Saprospiraceae bacterium]
MQTPLHKPWFRPITLCPIFLKVELGNPRQQCRFFGICNVQRIAPEDVAIFKPPNDMTVLAVVKRNNALSPWLFLYESMTSVAKHRFFGADTFLVETDFVCQLQVGISITDTKEIAIKAGYYPIEMSPDGVRVFF